MTNYSNDIVFVMLIFRNTATLWVKNTYTGAAYQHTYIQHKTMNKTIKRKKENKKGNIIFMTHIQNVLVMKTIL